MRQLRAARKQRDDKVKDEQSGIYQSSSGKIEAQIWDPHSQTMRYVGSYDRLVQAQTALAKARSIIKRKGMYVVAPSVKRKHVKAGQSSVRGVTAFRDSQYQVNCWFQNKQHFLGVFRRKQLAEAAARKFYADK
jgi:hypothetical protein